MKPSRHAAGERASAPVAASTITSSTTEPAATDGFKPVALTPRRNGWTAERQRTFLTVLAETGSVSHSCAQAGVSSRSAYRLRARPDAGAFADAWDIALKLATARLTALAFERATRGTVREVWKNGELHSSTRAPSDRLLMFLLQHLLPAGKPGDRWTGFEAMAIDARTSFPAMLADLADQNVEMVPISSRDFFGEVPGDQDEDV